jgi:hemoglobin-like flavoprotein
VNTPEGCHPPDGKPCNFVHAFAKITQYELMEQEILELRKRLDEKDRQLEYLKSVISNKKQQEITLKQYDICIDYLLKKITELSKNIRSAILDIPMSYEELEEDLGRKGLLISE